MNGIPQQHARLAPDLLRKRHAYWRAANHVSIAQDYLRINALREAPLQTEHVKPGQLCQQVPTAALNFLYVHLNRLIKENDLRLILVAGSRHGEAALAVQRYLEGSSTEHRPPSGNHRDRLLTPFDRQVQPNRLHGLVSTPVPSTGPEGCAGHARLHAYGAAFESPALMVACFIEDRQAEAGKLAAGWHGNAFLDPKLDGAVLPILHLGGARPCSPCAPARLSDDTLISVIRAQGLPALAGGMR